MGTTGELSHPHSLSDMAPMGNMYPPQQRPRAQQEQQHQQKPMEYQEAQEMQRPTFTNHYSQQLRRQQQEQLARLVSAGPPHQRSLADSRPQQEQQQQRHQTASSMEVASPPFMVDMVNLDLDMGYPPRIDFPPPPPSSVHPSSHHQRRHTLPLESNSTSTDNGFYPPNIPPYHPNPLPHLLSPQHQHPHHVLDFQAVPNNMGGAPSYHPHHTHHHQQQQQAQHHPQHPNHPQHMLYGATPQQAYAMDWAAVAAGPPLHQSDMLGSTNTITMSFGEMDPMHGLQVDQMHHRRGGPQGMVGEFKLPG